MRVILAKVSKLVSLHPTSTTVHPRPATIHPSHSESTALSDFGHMIESADVAFAVCEFAVAGPAVVSILGDVAPAACMLAAAFRSVHHLLDSVVAPVDHTPVAAVAVGRTPAVAVTVGHTLAVAVTVGHTLAVAVAVGHTPAVAVAVGHTPAAVTVEHTSDPVVDSHDRQFAGILLPKLRTAHRHLEVVIHIHSLDSILVVQFDHNVPLLERVSLLVASDGRAQGYPGSDCRTWIIPDRGLCSLDPFLCRMGPRLLSLLFCLHGEIGLA